MVTQHPVIAGVGDVKNGWRDGIIHRNAGGTVHLPAFDNVWPNTFYLVRRAGRSDIGRVAEDLNGFLEEGLPRTYRVASKEEGQESNKTGINQGYDEDSTRAGRQPSIANPPAPISPCAPGLMLCGSAIPRRCRYAGRFFVDRALRERIQFRVGILLLAERFFEERHDRVVAK